MNTTENLFSPKDEGHLKPCHSLLRKRLLLQAIRYSEAETIRWVYWRCSSSPFEVTLFCKCNYWAIGWWHDLLVSWIGSSSGEWWKILVLLHFSGTLTYFLLNSHQIEFGISSGTHGRYVTTVFADTDPARCHVPWTCSDFWELRVLRFCGTELMNSKECEENHTCIICAGWCRQFFFLKADVGSIVKTFASKLV